MKLTPFIVISLVIVIMLLSGCVPKEQTIKIGVIGSLTGNLAAQGTSQVNAVRMAVDELNAGWQGKKIELIVEDTANDPKKAATAAQKLIEVDGVVALLTDSTTMTMTVAPIAEQKKIPVMAYMSTSPEVTRAGDYVFRTSPSNLDGMNSLAELAFKKNGYRKVGILSEMVDYPQAVKKVFIASFASLGGVMVADEVFESSSSDVRTQLLKIKESSPDAILVLSQSPGTGAMVLRQIKENKMDLPILSNEGVANAESIKLAGDAAEGVIFTVPDFDPSKEKSAVFVQKFKGKYSDPPTWIYAAAAYDAMRIIAEAVDDVGTNGEKIKNQLYAIKDREGAIGRIGFDANGDPKMAFATMVIKGGKIVKYTD